MGGCASRPQDENFTPATLPEEKPLSCDTPAQEQTNGDETQKDEPLADVSEPAPKDSNVEGDVSADQSNVENVTTKEADEKAEAGNETAADLAKDTTETSKPNAASDEQLTSESSENKADSPVVSA